MMLQIGDDGVVSSVNEEDLIYVDKKELEQFIESYQKLEKENEQLKQYIKEIDDAELHLKQIILKRIDDYIGEWEDEGTPVAQVLKELQNELKGGDLE